MEVGGGALVISTNAGLAVCGGDVVRIETHPFRMQVVGRTTSYLNAFGEEVMVACRTGDCRGEHGGGCVRDYTAAPVFMNLEETGAHEWCIFSKPPAGGMALFMNCLDASLRRQNSDYDAKRTRGLARGSPLNVGGSRDVRQVVAAKLGGRHKVPRWPMTVPLWTRCWQGKRLERSELA